MKHFVQFSALLLALLMLFVSCGAETISVATSTESPLETSETRTPTAPTEPTTEPSTESSTEPVTEPTTEDPTEPATEDPTEPTTEDPTEPTTEDPTEPTTELPTEPTTEPPTEPTTELPTEPTTEPPTEPTTEDPTTEEPASEPYAPFYPEEKVIAITFDDGPDWWTQFILDTIDGTDDKVTFFITGYMIDNSGGEYAKFVKRAYDMGCDIGLHGYEHLNVWFDSEKRDASEEQIRHEIEDLAVKYKSITGADPQIFRPVGGRFNEHRNYGYPLILWTVDSHDWMIWDKYALDENGNWDKHHKLYADDPEEKAYYTELAVNEIVDRILSQIKSGDIVLMHDVYDISRQAFAKLYPILKEQGYKLVPVTELLNIDPSKHTGQYFYATYFYGEDGKETDLTRVKSTLMQALPPEKEYE